MLAIPQIKESDVRNWTDTVYFQRGQDYYQQGAIYDQRKQGMTLKSKCAGSQAPFYRQEVLFSSHGIESAQCSCPIGESGRCKHTVALLLTWVNDPDSFQETESLDVVLEKRSKAELIAVIKEMLEQEPDLESLLELPLAEGDRQPLNIKAIRRQANRAFQGTDFEWGYAREIKRDLNPLLKLAAGYLDRNDVENSTSVYEVIIETIFDNENSALGDEEGVLLGVVFDCCQGLGQCLPAVTSSKKRIEILQVLFSAYQWDSIKLGGVGAAENVPEILTTQTTPSECTEIATWTREIMPKGNGWSDGYHRELLGRLLLDLEADTLDDEAYLRICRQTGRLNDLIDRLLMLNRMDEAEAAARTAEDYSLFKATEIFTKHKRTDLAEKLVSERLQTGRDKDVDERLIEWLSDRLRGRGDLSSSLELEERLFWKYPNLERYKKLHKLAKQLDRWDALRIQIIAELEKKQDFDFLITLYLYEKEVELALAMLQKLPQRWGAHGPNLEVARAAKKHYPQESIRIFEQEAERFINDRNRGSYSQAALCLREIRDIYRQLNETQSWQKLITGVRDRHKRLPALQDELNQRKL